MALPYSLDRDDRRASELVRPIIGGLLATSGRSDSAPDAADTDVPVRIGRNRVSFPRVTRAEDELRSKLASGQPTVFVKPDADLSAGHIGPECCAATSNAVDDLAPGQPTDPQLAIRIEGRLPGIAAAATGMVLNGGVT
jgi:hypothetical protein